MHSENASAKCNGKKVVVVSLTKILEEHMDKGSMIKGVIFDMDGVMIDTENQSNLGWLWAAYKKNVEMPIWLIDSFKGAPSKLCEKFFDDYYHGTQNFWEMRQMRTDHIYKIRETEEVPVKPGLHKLLEYIKALKIKCAVATSTQKSSAEKSLHRIGAWDYLSGVVYGDEVEHGKPEPDIFLRAAEYIGCKPCECIVIEDSINGIKAGYAAGMRVVHIPDTIEINDDIRSLTSVVCQSLDDVVDIIKTWNAGNEPDKETYFKNVKMKNIYVDRVHVKKAFEQYTSAYNSSDPKIKLKIDHTYRVADLCERIARAAGMCAYDIELAWLSGMLHDIGRFEQVKRYNTFYDAESVDHAQFGADLLFKEGLINAFVGDVVEGNSTEMSERDVVEENSTEMPERDVVEEKSTEMPERGVVEENSTMMPVGICKEKMGIIGREDMGLLELVIRCHNMYRLPRELTEREKTFCNVLRDADKVDIIRVNIDTPLEEIYNTTTSKLKQSDITCEVMEAFYQEKCILKSIRKTPADTIVGHVSLAFELVYDESARLMWQQGYLTQLMNFKSENAVTNENLGKLRDKMEEYFKKRLN